MKNYAPKSVLLALFAGMLLLIGLLAVAPADAQLVESGPTAPLGDVASGVVIFQQRCANCHGPAGLGNGEMAAQLPNMPTAIGSAEYSLNAVPSAMYDVISNGRIERGMPLFGEGSSNPLSEQQRWDVIAAVYALATDAAELRRAGDLVDETLRAQLAAVNWPNTTNQAVAAALGDSDLTEADRLAVANWGRMALGADYFLPAGSVSGIVSNGTAGTPLAATEVTLRAFEGFSEAQSWTATTDASGIFAIDLQDVPADWVLFADLSYANLEYSSNFVQLTKADPDQVLDITVYDATGDNAAIQLDRLHAILEFGPQSLIVNEFYSYSNNGSTVYTGTLPFRLPQDAQDISFNTMSAMGQFAAATSVMPVADGFQEMRPLRPGSSALAMLVSYSLPYAGSVNISHALDYVPGSVTLIAPVGLQLGSEWTQVNVQTIEGDTFATYTAAPSDTFALSVGGTPQFAIDQSTGQRLLVRDEQRDLLIGSIALMATVVICVAVVRTWQQQAPPDPRPLLEEIAALDDAFAAREIRRPAYEQRRKRLMQELRDVWADDEAL